MDEIREEHAMWHRCGKTRWTWKQVQECLQEAHAALEAAREIKGKANALLQADPGFQQWHSLPDYWQYLDTHAGRAAHDLLRTDGERPIPLMPAKPDERFGSEGSLKDLVKWFRHNRTKERYPLTEYRKLLARWKKWTAYACGALAMAQELDAEKTEVMS